MEIVFTWSWLAFVAGIFTTLTVQFWLLVFVAYKQWRKGRKAKNNIDDMFKQWSGRDNS